MKHPIIYSWVTDSFFNIRKIRFTTDLESITEEYFSDRVPGRVAYSWCGNTMRPACHSIPYRNMTITEQNDLYNADEETCIRWLCFGEE